MGPPSAIHKNFRREIDFITPTADQPVKGHHQTHERAMPFNCRKRVCRAMGCHGAAAIADSGQMVQGILIKMNDLRHRFAVALRRMRRLMNTASGRKYPKTGPQDREEKVFPDISGFVYLEAHEKTG
jgi:hypothetical protein